MNTWKQVKKILYIRLDNMGDILMCQPSLRAIKHSQKHMHLTLLTSSSGAHIAKLIPEVDEVISFNVPWVKQSTNPEDSHIYPLIKQLQKNQYDAAIISTSFSQSPLPAAMFLYQAGIPLRLAYCHENPYGLLTDWIVDNEPGNGIQHEVVRQLDLVKNVVFKKTTDKISLPVSKRNKTKLRQFLLTIGIKPDEPYIILHPGASEEKRRVDISVFAEVGNMLSQKTHLPIIVTGSKNEVTLTQSLTNKVQGRCTSLAGILDIPDLISLISESSLLISNNTGPVHIASGVQTPVVVMYAKTNPQHTPWKIPHHVFYFDVEKKHASKNYFLQNLPFPEESYSLKRATDVSLTLLKQNVQAKGVYA